MKAAVSSEAGGSEETQDGWYIRAFAYEQEEDTCPAHQASFENDGGVRTLISVFAPQQKTLRSAAQTQELISFNHQWKQKLDWIRECEDPISSSLQLADHKEKSAQDVPKHEE